MCASPFKFLRTTPPPPKVVLLPSGLFFTRSIPVVAGGSSEIAAQVELALEASSPFPLAQLYYGWFARPGADRAFVFAAYRRRFTDDQMAGWEGAEVVMPAFAAAFGANLEPATTVLMAEPDGLTALGWDGPGVPSRVLTRPIGPEADEATWERTKSELLAAMGGSSTVIDLPGGPVTDASGNDREIVFRSGDFVSKLPSPVAATMDVRDRSELAALRGARRRDLVLWRVALGCLAALGLLALGELALVGGRTWQTIRVVRVNVQKPVVDKIMTAQELANRIEDLATKQLLPLEMLTELVGPNLERKPADIQFTRIQTDKSRGLYTVVIDAQTANAPQMSVYQTALEKLPSKEKVEFVPQPSRGQFATFRIIFTFKPGVIKPTSS